MKTSTLRRTPLQGEEAGEKQEDGEEEEDEEQEARLLLVRRREHGGVSEPLPRRDPDEKPPQLLEAGRTQAELHRAATGRLHAQVVLPLVLGGFWAGRHGTRRANSVENGQHVSKLGRMSANIGQVGLESIELRPSSTKCGPNSASVDQSWP